MVEVTGHGKYVLIFLLGFTVHVLAALRKEQSLFELIWRPLSMKSMRIGRLVGSKVVEEAKVSTYS